MTDRRTVEGKKKSADVAVEKLEAARRALVDVRMERRQERECMTKLEEVLDAIEGYVGGLEADGEA